MGPLTPPTKVRRNVRSALSTAALVAMGVGAGALAFLWRDLPFSPKPNGPLWEHAKYWSACAVHTGLPSFFEHKCRLYGGYLARLSANHESFGLYGRIVLAASAGLAVGAYVFNRGLIAADQLMHYRGFQLYSDAQAVARARQRCADEIRRESTPERDATDLIFQPGVGPFASERYARHIMVVGGIGSGKTQILTPLVAQIEKRRDRVLLFDIKRDFTQFFPGAIIVGASDARSWSWDIARDVRNKQAARRYAEIVIEASEKDPFWSNSSRALLVGFLMMLIAEKDTNWGWRELRDALMTPLDQLADIMEKHNPEAMAAVEEQKGGPSQTLKSIMMNLQAFCAPIYDLADAWGDMPPKMRFSVVDWFTNPNTKYRQVILQGDLSQAHLTHSYISAMFATACSKIDKLPEANRVRQRTDGLSDAIWFFCDELPALGKVESFDAAITLGRSKNVRWVAGLQSLGQLDDIYGKERAATWVGNMGTLVISRVAPGTAAAQIRDLIGKREVERPNLSISSGAGGKNSTLMNSRDEMFVLHEAQLATELGQQPILSDRFWRRLWQRINPWARRDTITRALVLGLGDSALILDWPRTILERRRRPYVEAAWVSRPPTARPGTLAADFVPADDDRGMTDEEIAAIEEMGGMTPEEYQRVQDLTLAVALASTGGMPLAAEPFGANTGAAARPETTPAGSGDPQGAANGAAASGFGGGARQLAEDPEFSGLFGGAGVSQSEREILRQIQRQAHRLKIQAVTTQSPLGRSRRQPAMGLSDNPTRRDAEDSQATATTADRINAFNPDPNLRRGLGEEETLAETAHGIHEVGETVGHEAHLSDGQTEHLTQGLLALDVLDSLSSGPGQTPQTNGGSIPANTRVLGRRR